MSPQENAGTAVILGRRLDLPQNVGPLIHLYPPTVFPLSHMRAVPILLTLLSSAVVLRADPALTIYNQDFAVVRDTVPLDLKVGTNEVHFADTTTQLEADSVILRDPEGKVHLSILEQSYRADPVSQSLLLSLYEGKTLDFLVETPNAVSTTVQGKIIRSGYVPQADNLQRYGNAYYQRQMAIANDRSGMGAPIIEVAGRLRFSLPGQPLFPALADDTILKPTLNWKIQSDQAAKFDAELGYVTGGMTWEADYSVVSPEKGDQLELVGLVTMDNQSGKTFANAKIKLMAGDVNKVRRDGSYGYAEFRSAARRELADAPGVTEKTFDEYHLYSLPRPVTLHDRETKQVEFVRAEGIASNLFYVYDGLKLDQESYRGYPMENIRVQSDYGTKSNPKVNVMREFKNSADNHLGLPLPKGRLRFYRRDSDGQLEFTGENTIDHTPKDEIIRAYTGNAFDLTGERKRTNIQMEASHYVDESFEIKLRNHKPEPVEIRVVEHLYRWTSWQIAQASNLWKKSDAQTIEFAVQVKPDEEKTVTYTVHYTW